MRHFIAISLFLTNILLYAQNQNISSFISQQWNNISEINLSKPNVDSIENELNAIEENIKSIYATKLNLPEEISLIKNDFRLTSFPDSLGVLYAVRIKSDSALMLNFFFGQFHLSENETIYIFGKQQNYLASLVDSDNQPHEKFPLYFMQGDEVTFAFHKTVTETVISAPLISSVYYVFREPFGPESGSHSQDCEENVYCPSYTVPSELKNVIRATFLLIAPEWRCTGELLNNRQNSLDKLFITARHCIHEGNLGQGELIDLTQLEYYFNYNNPDCNEQHPWPSYKHPSSGASLVDQSGFFGSDIALLRMSASPPPHFKVYYAGWSAAQIPMYTAFGNTYRFIAFGIHHPVGDIKKISLGEGYRVGYPPGRIKVDWDFGNVEDVSSGSGLFSTPGKLIGVLSGGFSSCDNDKPAWYGYFRRFFNENINARQALGGTINQNFNSGREITCYQGDLFLGGIVGNYLFFKGNDADYLPAGLYQPNNAITIKAENKIFAAGSGKGLKIYPNADFVFSAGEKVVLESGFIAEAGSHFVAEIAPCTPGPQRIYEYAQEDDNQNNHDIKALISPNPSTGKFTLQIPQEEESENPNYTIEIYNILGEKILQSEIQNSKSLIDLSSHPKGIYFLKIQSGENIYTEKIVVQ